MFKLLIPVLLLVILGTSGFFLYQNNQSQPQPSQSPLKSAETSYQVPTPQISSKPTTSDTCNVLVNGNNDLPSIPSYIKWDQPRLVSEEIIDYSNDKEGTLIMLDGCKYEALGIDIVNSDKVTNLYSEALRKNWKLANDFSGPNSSILTYSKGENYFSISKSISSDSTNDDLKYNLKIFYSNK